MTETIRCNENVNVIDWMWKQPVKSQNYMQCKHVKYIEYISRYCWTICDWIVSKLMVMCVLRFYRPQTKFAKVMFLHVFVCPQGGSTWAGTHPGQVHPPAGTPPGRYPPGQVHPQAGTDSQAGTPLDRYPPRQVHPLVRYTPWAGTLSQAGTPQAVHPLGRYTPPQVPPHS